MLDTGSILAARPVPEPPDGELPLYLLHHPEVFYLCFPNAIMGEINKFIGFVEPAEKKLNAPLLRERIIGKFLSGNQVYPFGTFIECYPHRFFILG